MIIKKTPEQIESMRAAGEILVDTLKLIEQRVKPGVTTLELDQAAEKYIRSKKAIPAFKGYHGFPASICASPNTVVVHGIPGKEKLQEGDILSVDIGVNLNGWIADAAITVAVGEANPVAAHLMETTRESLMLAVEQCQVGNRIGDISHAVQSKVESEGLSIVKSLVGHGVGSEMHEDPQVPNYGTAGRGPLIEEGMVIAIEPMVTAGRPAVKVAEDDWTIYTLDGSLAAHYEFTVAATAAGPEILTPWHQR